MSNEKNGSEIIRFFAERVDWDKSERQKLYETNKGWKYITIFCAVIATASVSVAGLVTASHQYVPIIVNVDKISGQYDVHVGKEQIDVSDKKNEKRMIADLGRYVRAREAFTRGEAEQNYKIVFYMSTKEERNAFDAIYKPELNERALLNTMKASDKINVTNMSITFLPTLETTTRVAQVRFEKERYVGGRATTQKYISTLTYSYRPDSIPDEIDGIVINPFGFIVSNFRTDKESEEREIVKEVKQ